MKRSDNIHYIKRTPQPLRKTYQPDAPFVMHRRDQDDGSISYEIFDERPDTYRFICALSDADGMNAKHDAEQIARGLNMLVQYGIELLPPNIDDE